MRQPAPQHFQASDGQSFIVAGITVSFMEKAMASGRKGKTELTPSAQELEEQVERCSTYLMGFLNNATMRYDSNIVCKFLLRYSALQVKAGIASGLLTPSQVDDLVSEFTRDIFHVPDSTN